MSSKNNPEMRGRKTEYPKVDGKEVRPILYINMDEKARYMAAVFESGDLVIGSNGKPTPYQSI